MLVLYCAGKVQLLSLEKEAGISEMMDCIFELLVFVLKTIVWFEDLLLFGMRKKKGSNGHLNTFREPKKGYPKKRRTMEKTKVRDSLSSSQSSPNGLIRKQFPHALYPRILGIKVGHVVSEPYCGTIQIQIAHC